MIPSSKFGTKGSRDGGRERKGWTLFVDPNEKISDSQHPLADSKTKKVEKKTHILLRHLLARCFWPTTNIVAHLLFFGILEGSASQA